MRPAFQTIFISSILASYLSSCTPVAPKKVDTKPIDIPKENISTEDSNSKSDLRVPPIKAIPDTSENSKILGDKAYADFLKSLEQPKLTKVPPVKLYDEEWFKPGKYDYIYPKAERDYDLKDIYTDPPEKPFPSVSKKPSKPTSRPKQGVAKKTTVIKPTVKINPYKKETNLTPNAPSIFEKIDPKDMDQAIEIVVPKPEKLLNTSKIIKRNLGDLPSKPEITPQLPVQIPEVVPAFPISRDTDSILPEPISSPSLEKPFPKVEKWPALPPTQQ